MESNRDIRLPARSILALRRALVREAGAEAGTRALQEAGHAAGDVLFDRLTRGLSEDPSGTPSTTFWDRLAALFRELGWGDVTHEELHPGVGALTARDWFEADPDAPRSACAFTTGVLANLLGRVAGKSVAVMTVESPSGEAGGCRFLFGSQQVLQEVYSSMRGGQELEASIAALG